MANNTLNHVYLNGGAENNDWALKGDGSKAPYVRDRNKISAGGVIDFGDLLQFAPYEKGYCFLVVFNAPTIFNDGGDNEYINTMKSLQEQFILALEVDFKGLNGIDDKTGEFYDIGLSNSPTHVLSRNNGMSSSTISISLEERTGTPVTKYLSGYLDSVRHPYMQAKVQNGRIGTIKDPYAARPSEEMFNMLYIITDSTCMIVEKAFFLLNATPTTAPYNELYNMDKGAIGPADISVTFNCIVRESKVANKIAAAYLSIITNSSSYHNGLVNLNSYEMDWTVSGIDSKKSKSSKINITKRKTDRETNFSLSKGIKQNVVKSNDYTTYTGN